MSNTESSLAARRPASLEEPDEATERFDVKWGNASIEARAPPAPPAPPDFYNSQNALIALQPDADPSLTILSQQPKIDANGRRIGPREPLSNLDKYAYNASRGVGTTVYIIDQYVDPEDKTLQDRLKPVSPNLNWGLTCY